MKKVIFVLIFILTASVYYCETCVAQKNKEGALAMKVTSPSFKNNEKMPAKFTYDGEDVNPALEIDNLPDGTKSLALIVDDPDAPMKTWVHWVVYDIVPVTRIEEDSIPGKQGVNDSGGRDYHGPCPPSGTHRYYFKVYALNKILEMKEGASKGELEKAMQGNILASAELVGLYNRGKGKR